MQWKNEKRAALAAQGGTGLIRLVMVMGVFVTMAYLAI